MNDTSSIDPSRGESSDTPENLYFQIVCDPGHERTARELSLLPRELRESVWADMTGTSIPDIRRRQVNSRYPDSALNGMDDIRLIDELLKAMAAEVTRLPQSKPIESALATDMAQDLHFRLAFLCAEEYDVTRAAERFIRHFEQKEALFGPSKAGVPIQLCDLSDDDCESLQCGAMQFLPKTDRGGRLVFVSRYRNFKYKTRENLVR